MAVDQYDILMLDPANISFSRGTGGMLQGVIDGTAYEEIVLHRTFPFTRPNEYISVRNGNGEEIGIIGDLNPLDEESKREVETELRLRYLIPQVTSILSIKHNSDMWNWELQTNLGPIRMSMRNLHEYIQFPSRERMLITDMVGRRCEISNLSKLDSQSTKELSKIM